ncbi:MAG TPA: polysaccharide biosynthesis tyrosine autokinase, partial [Flavitalea sp.]|nr:polysaccharide biosynthesis tyrosine autokinase [Flavitalea sp.]
QMWNRYFPYWPAFVALIVLFVGAAWLYVGKQHPQYEATATLIIKDESKGIDDSKMIESLNLISTKKIVENEIEVLTSRSLLHEVVLKLKLYAPVSIEGGLRDSSAYAVSPIKIEVKDLRKFVEYPRIDFSYDRSASKIMIDGQAFPINAWTKTPYGDLKFDTTGLPATGYSNKFYFSLIDPKKVTQTLMKSLEVSPSSKLSTVIDLQLRAEDRTLAEDILNELIHGYNQAAVDEKNILASRTLEFVQSRLNFISHHLDSIEKKVQQYKSAAGAVDISSQGKLFLENVSTSDEKLADVNIQLAVLDQIEKFIQEKEFSGSIVPSSLGVNDPLLTGLLEKLYDAELEKERLKKTTGENSPLMVAITDQINKIKPSILDNIRSQRASLEANKKNQTKTSSGYSAMLNSIPQKERDLLEITRQQNLANSIYSFLLQKREEATLSNSSPVADTRVVDNAEASILPVSPNKKLIYILSFVSALMIGFLIITSKEVLNRKILYRSEVESKTVIPIVGEIGFMKGADNTQETGLDPLIAEQFRKLRISLRFIGLNNKKKKMLITSAIPGDGKSFITSNLGLIIALTGKKVVIVEADLSNPGLSAKMKIESDNGLSTYLIGEVEPEEIIRRTKINENLFVIPTGPLPPNPSELILNEKIGVLLNYLEQVFDYVIVDSAPVEALSDAYALSPMCDATLFVIRHGHTPKIAVERIDKNNVVNTLKNAGIIFNGVKNRGFGKNSYGYGYGYGYGYSYGAAFQKTTGSKLKKNQTKV